jgi:hypothetical protein
VAPAKRKIQRGQIGFLDKLCSLLGWSPPAQQEKVPEPDSKDEEGGGKKRVH